MGNFAYITYLYNRSERLFDDVARERDEPLEKLQKVEIARTRAETIRCKMGNYYNATRRKGDNAIYIAAAEAFQRHQNTRDS